LTRSTQELKKIHLKKNKEHRILKGEVWIYRDEVQDKEDFSPGELVKVHTWKDDYLATGYVNAATTIAVRVLTRDENEAIDDVFFSKRIRAADDLRKALHPGKHYYRMVYGEADQLPGLVIDRYDDYFVVQVTTAGMENSRKIIFDTIAQLYPRGTIVEKSIGASRQKENLETRNRLVTPGKSPEKIIEINGIKFKLNFLNSQKTGFFLDQRENYLMLKNISKGKEILDVFSYAGAWGLHAYGFGARHVQYLEVSGQYLEQTRENILLNGFDMDDFSLDKADAVTRLKEMADKEMHRDIVILDPPAFIKSRSKIKDGIRGYREINLRALKIVNPGGYLVSCSCSHFFTREDFLDLIYKTALAAGRQIQLLMYRTQPYDHPILLPLFHSEYLKCALFTVK
jgi:23S rRNA (cytosine1962-C5)-methyltransferase